MKLNKLFLLVLLFAGLQTAHATIQGTPFSPEVDKRFDALENSIANNSSQSLKVARFTYDVAVNGGAAATYNLGVYLPANALVISSELYFKTQLVKTSSATLALQCANANDIKTAADYTSSAAGSVLIGAISDGATVANVLTHVHVTSRCQIAAVVAGGTFTAGKVNGFLQYYTTD